MQVERQTGTDRKTSRKGKQKKGIMKEDSKGRMRKKCGNGS
jgi:hypothetical protein